MQRDKPGTRKSESRLLDGWQLLVLVWAMLMIACLAILQADLIDGLYVLPFVTTLALLAGWLLAKSKFSSRTAHIFALVYGTFFVVYFVGTVLPYEAPWSDRVYDLVSRQATWLQKAFSGGTSRDGLIFVLQTTALFWLMGYLAGWYTFRKQRIWRVVIPIGIVLLSVVYYYTGPRPLLLYLGIFTLLALLYIAITHLTGEEIGWRQQTVRYDKAIRFDFLRSGLLAAALALMIAWTLPTMQANAAVGDALSGAQGPWRGFQDNWTRLFSSLRSYGAGTSDPYQDNLILGGPRTVGNNLAMDVKVSEPLPYGVYWAAIAYDTYENGGWFARGTDRDAIIHYPDDGNLDVPDTLARQVITQTVTNYLPNSSFLYAAPEVLNTSKQMLVEATFDDDGQALVQAVRSRFVLRQGDQYQVLSRVSVADANSLRHTSTLYPEWVTDRYLQLPEDISPETLALAEDLSGGYDDPFTKAIVIRDYLRETITYNDQIAAPPDGVEAVHHVLFDVQEGYCNYYASAMAVMLRSQGVPTRVVSGYALGEFDDLVQNYRVRSSNLHTWVEVYFPGYGWIQFEPTASIPVFERPEDSGVGGDAFASGVIPSSESSRDDLLPDDEFFEEAISTDFDNFGADSQPGGFLSEFAWWQAGLAAVVLLVAGLLLYFGNAYNQRIEANVDKSYSRLGRWAQRLGVNWRGNQTPYERAEVMVSAVPAGSEPIRNLTTQYVNKRFSPSKSAESGFNPRDEWRVLRPLLLRESIVRFLDRSRGKDNASP